MIARYIDRYNRIRRHSSCEMKSPIDYEAVLATRPAQEAQHERRLEGGPSEPHTGPQTTRG